MDGSADDGSCSANREEVRFSLLCVQVVQSSARTVGSTVPSKYLRTDVMVQLVNYTTRKKKGFKGFGGRGGYAHVPFSFLYLEYVQRVVVICMYVIALSRVSVGNWGGSGGRWLRRVSIQKHGELPVKIWG
jgi:hypothetical protein